MICEGLEPVPCLCSCEHCHMNGILADEMGLGKTIMTIALLARLSCAK